MRQYVIAVYIRLSAEDRDKCDNAKDESNSITLQRKLIHGYIIKSSSLRNSEILEFCDDGYTGTNLNRPALQEMLRKIDEGAINCVIVKDISRFARNHIDIGHYIEVHFPLKGVRFISVNDNYDSDDYDGSTPDMGFSFTALLHEMYSSDLSEKIRSARLTKAKEGKYINHFAPYGYKKSIRDKNKLEVDDPAAEIVRHIFQMRLEGKSLKNIAQTLNAEGVPTPGQYKVMNGCRRNWEPLMKKSFWDSSNIRLILRDERYLGRCVFGKRLRYCVGYAKTKAVPKSEWIVVKDTHEAILSEDDFHKVQSTFKKYPNKRAPVKGKNALTNRIRCGNCLHKIEVSGSTLFCSTPTFDKSYDCFRDKVRVHEIEAIILRLLQMYINALVSFGEEQKQSKLNRQKAQKPVDTKTLEMEIEKLLNHKLECFGSYTENKISEQEYEERRSVLNGKIDSLQKEIEVIKSQGIIEPDINIRNHCIFEEARKFNGITELSPEVVETFIDCVYIHSAGDIEVVWSFNDIIQYLPKE